MEGDSLNINQEDTFHFSNPRSNFVIAKVLPIIFFVFILSLKLTNTIVFSISIALIALDFFITKNSGGPQLVGLEWSIATNIESNSILQYLTKPYPWIPNPADNNTFWILNFISLCFYVIGAVVSIFAKTFFHFFLAAIGLIANGINFMLFIHALKILQIENAQIARSFDDTLDPLNLADLTSHKEIIENESDSEAN